MPKKDSFSTHSAVEFSRDVLELARYALGVGQRANLLPQDYTLEQFIIDAAWERANILVKSRALGFGEVVSLVIDSPRVIGGEYTEDADNPHYTIFQD